MAQAGDKRGVAFAAIVVVVAAVGIYLTMWPTSDDPSTEQPVAGPTTSSSVAPSKPLATASGAPFDIYSYLPMSKQELAAAADLAERFTASYGTFRYDEDPAAYLARIKVFTTPELGNVLAKTRTSVDTADQVVATSTAKMKQIRQVSRTSVVFVVTGTQQLTGKSGTKQQADDYAVTVSEAGNDWRIFDIQPADDGQDGDTQG
ncbi:hypothetical protein ACIBHX_21740 [Nonomuraea sp. NPDC050536]|uniref:hypothetical protein n=1 Tax=Nonomuraea sp. NPDC050536 TaxID=3364366 RepID=UPI0037C6856A